jgi:Flp pilus assembly protein TadB
MTVEGDMTVSQDPDRTRDGGESRRSGHRLTGTQRLLAVALVLVVVVVVVVVTHSAAAVSGVIGSMVVLLVWLSNDGDSGGTAANS